MQIVIQTMCKFKYSYCSEKKSAKNKNKKKNAFQTTQTRSYWILKHCELVMVNDGGFEFSSA